MLYINKLEIIAEESSASHFFSLTLHKFASSFTLEMKRLRTCIAIISALICATSFAQDMLPYPQRIAAKLDSLCALDMFETSQLSLMVYDLDAESTLYARNERQLMRPASTMKLFTAITALDQLGRNHSFRTSLHYTGDTIGTALNGNICIRGTMDPTLEDYDIDCLVEGITAMNIDTIRGGIIADRSFKDSLMLGEGWCWDDDNPILSPLVFQRKDSLTHILRSKLGSLGIVIIGGDSIGALPADTKLLSERTTSIETVLEKMMKDSDNLYAEAMYYHVGASIEQPSTAKSAQEAVSRTMAQAGLNPKTYRLADGSGLSLYNYLSAEAEVSMLRYAYKNKDIFGILCQSLPIAGIDGTLKRRMKKTAAHGNVRAKTGSLSGVYTLAGYCTSPENHLIAFCIMNQGVMKSRPARDFQDKVCEALCQ